MVREYLEWIDNKFDWEVETDTKKKYRKAFFAGMAEGVLEAVVVSGTIVTVIGTVKIIRSVIRF